MARPATARERFIKWKRRNPRLAVMAVVGLAAACLELAGIFWQWNQARRETRRAEQARTKTLQVLRQMEAIQLRRAEEYIDAGRRTEALPYLALVVRQNPLDRLAAFDTLPLCLPPRIWTRPTPRSSPGWRGISGPPRPTRPPRTGRGWPTR
jgi:hypothetical protein